jgi:protein subunit release factor B
MASANAPQPHVQGLTVNNLLFSITKDDFVIETFRAGGKGGQKQNKTNSGVRIKHPPSGAVAESREYAEQHRNKVAAFGKIVEDPKLKAYIKMEAARLSGKPSPEQIVDELMDESNLRIEGKKDGKWQTI